MVNALKRTPEGLTASVAWFDVIGRRSQRLADITQQHVLGGTHEKCVGTSLAPTYPYVMTLQAFQVLAVCRPRHYGEKGHGAGRANTSG